MGWTYRGANVQVPRTADIPPKFWSQGPRGEVVQRVLDMVEPWHEGDDPIETKQLDRDWFMPIVVPLNGRTPWWGIHAGHHARVPQASPFIKLDFNRLTPTDLFTVELVQTPQRPKLVRAYPGDYIPPLPWMASASSAQGGIAACRTFWCNHAYVYMKSTMVSRRRQPDWFRK